MYSPPRPDYTLQKWLEKSKAGRRICTTVEVLKRLGVNDSVIWWLLPMESCERCRDIFGPRRIRWCRNCHLTAYCGDLCLNEDRPSHRNICKTVDRDALIDIEKIIMRWTQVYFGHMKTMFGLLAGLRPEQTRETQHLIISRLVFQFFLAPKTTGQTPKTYHDLRFVRACKVDARHPSIRPFLDKINQLVYQLEEDGSRTQLDNLIAPAIAFYTPDFTDTCQLSTAMPIPFFVNSIPYAKHPSSPSNAGYPDNLTIDLVQMVMNAHMDDDSENFAARSLKGSEETD